MKRFAAFYDDGVLNALSVAEGPKGSDGLHSDPAGDDAPESTFAENFLKTIWATAAGARDDYDAPRGHHMCRAGPKTSRARF